MVVVVLLLVDRPTTRWSAICMSSCTGRAQGSARTSSPHHDKPLACR